MCPTGKILFFHRRSALGLHLRADLHPQVSCLTDEVCAEGEIFQNAATTHRYSGEEGASPGPSRWGAPLEPNLKLTQQTEGKQPVHPELQPRLSAGCSARGLPVSPHTPYPGPTGSAGLGRGLEGPAGGETIFSGMWVSLWGPTDTSSCTAQAPCSA